MGTVVARNEFFWSGVRIRAVRGSGGAELTGVCGRLGVLTGRSSRYLRKPGAVGPVSWPNTGSPSSSSSFVPAEFDTHRHTDVVRDTRGAPSTPAPPPASHSGCGHPATGCAGRHQPSRSSRSAAMDDRSITSLNGRSTYSSAARRAAGPGGIRPSPGAPHHSFPTLPGWATWPRSRVEEEALRPPQALPLTP